MPQVPDPPQFAHLDSARLKAILETQYKWVNGTALRYYFYDRDSDGAYVEYPNGSRAWQSWVGAEEQRAVVRRAFQEWKGLGIGLNFEEVDDRTEAEVRIGFMQGDGSWSYIGTYVLEKGPAERTMNFGWDLTQRDGYDTALHEIGHTLGLPHEHQNPYAGIVWDEEAVYAALGRPPNNWSRETTYHNILRKLDRSAVKGSRWDPDSVMHYPFGPGLIRLPEDYHTDGLRPAGGLSEVDKAWARQFYPSHDKKAYPELVALKSEPLAAANGQQQDFVIHPPATRTYEFRTFGASDAVMVLFEEVDGVPRFLAGDDDSAEDRNASLQVKLFKGRHYILRVRLRYTDAATPPAVMMW